MSVTAAKLLRLLPNGLTYAARLSRETSKKLNGKIEFDKKKQIAPNDEFMVLCIIGKCRKNIDKQTPIKPSSFTRSHLNTQHKKHKNKDLDKQILIHSHFEVGGVGKEKYYKKQYLLIKITGPSTFAYIKRKSSSSSSGYDCFPEIDLTNQQSSIYRIKSIEHKSEDRDNDDNDNHNDIDMDTKDAMTDNTAFNNIHNDIKDIKNVIVKLSSSIKLISVKKKKETFITDYYQPAPNQNVPSRDPTISRTKIKRKYCIPAKNIDFLTFQQKKGKYLIDITYNANIEKFCGQCSLCKKYMILLRKKYRYLGEAITGFYIK